MTFTRERISEIGDTGRGKKQLHTKDIAGAGTSEIEEFIEVKPDGSNGGAEQAPFFPDDVNRDFRARWQDIQTGFVDEPRDCVEQADELVAELMQRLAQNFSEQRVELEKQWEASEQVSTEDLRIALRRYRTFFERLLSI